MQELVGIALIILGGVILVWATYKLNDQKKRLVMSETAVGTFIGYEYPKNLNPHQTNQAESASPKVNFTTKDGRDITFVNSANLSDEADRNNLEVLYTLDAPEKAIVNDYFGMWGWLFVVGGFGLIFMFVGILLWKVL